MAAKATESRPRPGPAKKRILIVDDHPVLRRGLAALIESEPDLLVRGEADSCAAALDFIRGHRLDLVIVDLALPGRDGLELLKELKARHPKVPTLVLSMYDESVYAERCFRAGAQGFVNKHELDQTVLIAIRRVLAGKIYMSEKLQARLATRFVRGLAEVDSPLEALSDRQLEVFRLIGLGRTTRQIAEILHLSVKTIEAHREQIKHKLAIESGVELVRRSTRWVETGRYN